MKNNAARLSTAVKLGYGVADAGAGLMIMAMGLYYLIFLTDVVRLKPELAALVVLVGKIYDAVTDPLAGVISDRTRTAIGRRRPYLAAAAIPFGAGFALVFMAPFLSQAGAFWYALGTFVFLNTAFTVYNVPYSALSADLTTDYDERTSLTGYRMFFSLLGTICGAALVLPLVGLRSTEKEGYAFMALVLGAFIALVSLVTFLVTREKTRSGDESSLNLAASIRISFSCAPFRRAVIIFLLVQIALNTILAAMMYYLKYVVGMEEQSTFVFLAFLLATIFSLPLWVKVSGKVGKARTWALGVCLQAPALAALALLPAGQPALVYAMAILAGLGTAPHYLCPWAMVPDVVEYDQLTTGERRAGAFSGLWLFTQKVGIALGMAMTGAVLALCNYSGGEVQPPEALLGIRLVMGVLPVLFLVIGAILLWDYPINRRTHEAVKSRLPAGSSPAGGSFPEGRGPSC